MNLELISTQVERLIVEGQHIVNTTSKELPDYDTYVDRQLFSKWLPGCRLLMQTLGTFATPFSEPFQDSVEYGGIGRIKSMLGALHAIRESLQHGLLITVEDLVTAKTFVSLLEQADHLFSLGYDLAAGVIGRAVLEEHLRNLCDHSGCTPAKPRPTLSDFNAALKAKPVYNATVWRHVELLIDIGNNAAHNKPALTKPHVEQLLRDVGMILAQHPIS